MQEINSINVLEKFSLFEKLWAQHIIGELNGEYVKLCKLKNDFVGTAIRKRMNFFLYLVAH